MLALSVVMGVPFHELRQWSAAEILLYQAYYRISPFGEERADIRNAMQMAMTANMHRDPSKRQQPFEYTDFMPFAKREEKPMDAEGMKSAFMALVGK